MIALEFLLRYLAYAIAETLCVYACARIADRRTMLLMLALVFVIAIAMAYAGVADTDADAMYREHAAAQHRPPSHAPHPADKHQRYL